MKRLMLLLSAMGVLLLSLAVGFEALAQESETELAKKTQNPVADLISIPVQNNTNFSFGVRWGQAKAARSEQLDEEHRESDGAVPEQFRKKIT